MRAGDDERRINYEWPKIDLRYVLTMPLHQEYCLTLLLLLSLYLMLTLKTKLKITIKKKL